VTAKSPALSLTTAPKDSIRTRQVAILVADGYRHAELSRLAAALAKAGARSRIVAKSLGPVKSAEGKSTPVDHTFLTTGSIMFDAVYVPGGSSSVAALKTLGNAVEFVEEAYLHGKAIAASGDGVELLAEANLGGVRLADASTGGVVAEQGVVASRESGVVALGQEFIAAIAAHRHFARERKDQGGNLLRLKTRPKAA
jgi:catalase